MFDYRYRWHLYHDIDLDAVTEAASRFVGKHDFASFQAVGSPRKSTTRNVKVCEIIREPSMHGGGFLYNMVRNIVGTLMEVGKGKYPPQHIDNVIEAANRDVAGPTAPPQALFLKRVDYLPFA